MYRAMYLPIVPANLRAERLELPEFGAKEVMRDGPGGDLGSRMESELAENVRHMSIDGGRGNGKGVANLTVGQPLRDQDRDLTLAGTQRCVRAPLLDPRWRRNRHDRWRLRIRTDPEETPGAGFPGQEATL